MSMARETGGRRIALVIATGSYADPALEGLRAPGQDASEFASVLEDQDVGGFHVECVIDAPAQLLRRRVAEFCAQGAPSDLALVYLSCHGILDDRGRLHYAAVDTDRALLSATAVSAVWLNEQLDDCRCRRQVLVLDCCHSGAFARGAKGEGGLALGERFEGRGRVVLTGSRAAEYSFERGAIVGEPTSSVFTGVLVEGLRSGDADRDQDGVVTVAELYDYAYEAVRACDPRQTPTLWAYGAEGDLLVARSPRGVGVGSTQLPEDLIGLLESSRPRVREGAVVELADLLTGPDTGLALMARNRLEKVAAEDVASVAVVASAALAGKPPFCRPPPAPLPTQAEAVPPSRADVSKSVRFRSRRPPKVAIVGAAVAVASGLTIWLGVLDVGGQSHLGQAANTAKRQSAANASLHKAPTIAHRTQTRARTKPATPTLNTVSPSHSATFSSAGTGSWQRGFDGYTVALASDIIKADAVGAVSTAKAAGMPGVGFVWSSNYRSLTPGYWFVFSGAYASREEAGTHVADAVRAGFRDAYVRYIAG
ncbi:MAG: caspase family protein [Solirubrobacteraceae bacterium]